MVAFVGLEGANWPARVCGEEKNISQERQLDTQTVRLGRANNGRSTICISERILLHFYLERILIHWL